ncbi:fibronectin type III domain-containing protein [uncultured Chitinophaga sp.]|uniref:fibronectin type III domain-containing protein n=1 Tax=uncultured Chitinophaga sp. TaxID=339340 RepID=UPI00260C71A6|nr:fibronectin type III domain-containing protein [uncultured Chitinophaga sp.]
MLKFYLRLVLLVLFSTQTSWAQVLNPNDPVVTYNPSSPPAQPTWGQIGKWVRTARVSWNSSGYKCYIYKGMQFRLHYPKNFNAADTSKKYPIIVFWHGIGEKGGLYDNEYQLFHGGQVHDQRIASGAYDGFLLYPQNQFGYFGPTQYDYVNELINNFFVPQLNVDPFRVIVNGLSGGGAACWDFMFRYPKLVAAATPISAALDTYDDNIQTWKWTSVWHLQGGADKNPPPQVAQLIESTAKSVGANYKLKIYAGQGHGIWNLVWNEADYFPFVMRQYKSNPWALYGQTEFCPGTPVNAVLGLTAGFDQYQWRKDGVIIAGATGNTYTATSFGTYDARIRSGSRWSEWSRIPIVIKTKTPTVTPDIMMAGIQSNVLPTPEGKDSVVLSLPEGYASYQWLRQGTSDTIGRASTFTARQPGNYVARVTEQFGCSSNLSSPFKVISASGAPAPDAANGLVATATSKTAIKLDWSDKPSPQYNETFFEIYRATSPGGPYTLAGKTATDVRTFTNNGLENNTQYYFIVRSVNNNGAAPVSNEATATTLADNKPPTAPGNLTVGSVTRTSASLSWSSATDDVGIDRYDIYINGKKSFSIPQIGTGTQTFVAYGLNFGTTYTFVVKARDAAGNESPASNQVVAIAQNTSGLTYKYYEGSWNNLPDFNSLTPIKTGVSANVDKNVRNRSDNFAIMWEGYINIPTTGTYTFETYSDAGSKLYINTPYSANATALVNNDGIHNAQYRSGTITLAAGTYPIVLTYFDRTGSDEIRLYWRNNVGINSRTQIPNSAFRDNLSLGAAPSAPSGISASVVSHTKLKVSWNNSVTNETGFEVYRSTSSGGTYTIVGRTAANVTSFTDTALNPNTTYYYRLKTINNNGSSGFTSTASARTAVLPAIPPAPTLLVATAVSGNRIDLTWKDNSTTETGFEIYRSANDASNFVLIATTPPNAGAQAAYADSGLFANSLFYYRVRAKNDGGNSSYTNTVNATTLNGLPEIVGTEDRTMRYGTQTSFQIGAVDPDGEDVTITSPNLPAFGAITPSGDGGVNLIFSPGAGDQGVYNIQIKATDEHNGSTTATFTLTVNDNFMPQLSPISNVSLAEKGSAVVNLSSSDANSGDPTNWSATGLPAFAVLSPEGNTAQIQLNPGYADAGVYNVTVKVDDGKGAFDTRSFTITVTDVNPNYTVYIDFGDGAWAPPSPWFNTNKRPAQNDVFPALKDQLGRTTNMSMTILTPWQNVNGGTNTNNQGANTGNNSGVYPDAVMVTNWWTTTDLQTIRFNGLDPQFKYSFTMFGSRAGISDDRVASYTINGTTVTLNARNNSSQTVSINDVRPDANGGISMNIVAAPGSQYAYINAMVITASFDDESAPAKPLNFSGEVVSNGVQLSWSDQAFNETGYEVSRSANQAGPFTVLNANPTNANATGYLDATAGSATTWYYRVRGLNGYGASQYTDTIAVVIPNKAPVIAAISNVTMKSGTSQQVNFTATDAATDVITLSATGLPAFAVFQDLGNGSGRFTLTPGAGDIGKYTLTARAKDNSGDTSSVSFTVTVTDAKITSVYVNANQVEPAGAPWNNFNALPNVNAGITNLLDEAGAATGINITVLDQFTGANNVGAETGNNSGVYPDAVMKTFFFDQSNSDRRIRISGLSATRKYNLVFFGSRTSVSDNRNTTYTAGGQSVTLNAASNTSNTVQLNGLTPDASGNIVFVVRQTSGSVAAYLNALVIQSYVDDGTPLAPSNLTATANSRTSIQLNWADKASNETGYQVWRATSATGTYSLITTVGPNVTTYADNNLSQNTVYFYKVRAAAGALFSAYSNVASGGTMAYGVMINFTTTTSIANAPWNNTAALPFAGLTMNNLMDDNSVNTYMSMQIIDNFTGTNPAGMQTGNNSGVYPDKVLAESYYTETDTALLRITRLDQTKRYSFTFLGNRGSGGTRITAYSIGGHVVTLDANDNTQNTVTINDVIPDENGDIFIKVYTYLNYGYLNAMVIKAYPLGDSSGLVNLPVVGATMDAGRTTNKLVTLSGALNDAKLTQSEDAATNGVSVEKAFPNPFNTFINLYYTQQQADTRVTVRLLDVTGRLILTKDLGIRGKGQYMERLDLGNAQLNHGVYFLQIMSENKAVKTIKLLKN